MLLAKFLQYLTKGTDFVHLIAIKINMSQCSVKLHYHPEADQISLMLSLSASRYKSWTILHVYLNYTTWISELSKNGHIFLTEIWSKNDICIQKEKKKETKICGIRCNEQYILCVQYYSILTYMNSLLRMHRKKMFLLNQNRVQ